MTLKKRFSVALLFSLLMAVFVTGVAFAHYCTVASKPEGAGSVAVINVITGEFTPAKNIVDLDGDGFPDVINGGFITFTDGEISVDVFIHRVLPLGALLSGPDGGNLCDRLGIDAAIACPEFAGW